MGLNNGSRVAASAPKAGGGLWWAPLGTAAPTDATTALDAKFVCLGPISDDGIQPGRDTNTEDVKEWDGSTLATLLTEESRTFEATLLGALDGDVLKFVNGPDNVEITAATSTAGTKISVVDKGGQLPKGVLVIETRYGDTKMRDVAEQVQPTITDVQAMTKGGLRGWTASFACQKNEAGEFASFYAELADKTA